MHIVKSAGPPPFCHYEKLKEDLTKKGKKKYFITITDPINFPKRTESPVGVKITH
jgi:hypothetical protein